VHRHACDLILLLLPSLDCASLLHGGALAAQSLGRPDSHPGKEPALLHEFNGLRGIPVFSDRHGLFTVVEDGAFVRSRI
jgi:hypothetical protein